MPHTIVSTGDRAVNKKDKAPSFLKLIISKI